MVKVKKSSIAKVFSVKNVIIAIAALSLLVVTTFIVSGTETQEFVFGSFAKTNKTVACKKKPAAPKDCDGVGNDKKVGIFNEKKCEWSCTSPAKAVEYYGPETKLGERCPDDSEKGRDYRYVPATATSASTLCRDCYIDQTKCSGTAATPTATPTSVATTGGQPTAGCYFQGGKKYCNGKAMPQPEGYLYTNAGQLVTECSGTYFTESALGSISCYLPSGTSIKEYYKCKNGGARIKTVQGWTCPNIETTPTATPTDTKLVLKKPQCTSTLVLAGQYATYCYDARNNRQQECLPPYKVVNSTCVAETQTNDGTTGNTGNGPTSTPILSTITPPTSTGTITETPAPQAPDAGTPVLTATPTSAPAPEAPPALESFAPGDRETSLVTMPFGQAFSGSTISSIIEDSNYLVVGKGSISGKAGIASLSLPTQAEIDEKKESYNRCMWYGILFFRKDVCLAENRIPVVVYYPPEVAEQKTCSEYQAAQATVTVASQANDKLSSINDFDFIDVKCAIY